MFKRNQKSGPAGRARKQDMDQKTLDIRRTARVVAGGRRFSFRAAVGVGDRNGRVGMGMGKGPSVAEAIDKAVFQAKKALIAVPLTRERSIPHAIEAKFSAARIFMRPAREGKGLVAGGPLRSLAELAGIRNLTAKVMGRTPNKLNNARAAMEAFKKLDQESRSKNQGEKGKSAVLDS